MGKIACFLMLVLVLGTACSRKAYQGIETTTDTVITDSVRIEYIPRIIEVPVPMDSVRVDTVVKIVTVNQSPQVQDLHITGVNGIVGVEAWLKNNHLSALGYVRDSTIYYKADSLEKVIHSLRTIKKTTVTKKEELRIKKKIPTIGWLGIAFFLLTIIYLVSKVFNIDYKKLFSSLFGR